MVAAGVAAPLMRKRVKAPPLVMQAVAFGAPLGLSVAVRRSRRRDIAVCTLQMWAYLAEYKSPHDDAEAQLTRVRVGYPIAADRVLGLGEPPSVRLQRRFARGRLGAPEWSAHDRVLVWTHWSWFAFPHSTLLYILVRDRSSFARAALLTYAVFDLGASVYWLLPTAPPWYAAEQAYTRGGAGAYPEGHPPWRQAGRQASEHDAQTLEVRRLMVEYGESFWRDRWGSLYSVFGGNPLAAMPSLHFATSVMATLLLAETGPVAGALGASYTATLGLALVYLGEHYAVDLLAGVGLTLVVRRLGPRAGPVLERFGRAVAALEEMAHAPA
jgi:PAP2 superfamily